MLKNVKQRIMALGLAAVMATGFALPVFAAKAKATTEVKKPVIGISWKSNKQNYANFKKVIEEAGGIAVELKQVTSKDVVYDKDGKIVEQCLEPTGMLKQTYADKIKAKKFGATNAAEAMKGIDGVFFTGGEDISPSLFKVPVKEENCGETINATRDISDYTLWAYCLKKNIPALGVCRGEQMLGIVSGTKFLQDIPTYYASKGAKYADLHRMPVGAKNRTYARHNVELTTKKSHLYDIVGAMSLANVSSWHHQSVVDLKGTDLIQTARTIYNGIEIVEGIENPKKTFAVGVQFHPENDCSLAIAQNKPEAALCDVDICLNFLQTLVKYAGQNKK